MVIILNLSAIYQFLYLNLLTKYVKGDYDNLIYL